MQAEQGAERVSTTLQGFFAKAAAQGDRAVAVARLVVCTLGLARLLVFRFDAIFYASHPQSPKYWIAISGMCIGLAFSGLVLLRRIDPTRAWRWATMSILLDTLVVLMILAPIHAWPHSGYVGMLREIETSLLLLVVMAAGVRLSPRATIMAIVANAVAFGLLIALDYMHAPPNAAPLGYGLADIMLAGVIYVGACTLGWAGTSWTRRLVLSGARAYMQAEKARQRLGVFVSKEVASEVLAPGELKLGGQGREAAILFSDLRGFTRYSEKLPPAQVVAEMNDYFEAMVAVIQEHGGLVDKFIGDAIMVVFGVLERHGNPAAKAIRTAEAMQRALERHNTRRARRGLPPLRQGIGVHFGPVVAGNIGTQDRMQYTVVGDVVNVASRLESTTKELGVCVLVSAEALAKATSEPVDPPLPPTEPRGRLPIRGREEGLQVFTLSGLRS